MSVAANRIYRLRPGHTVSNGPAPAGTAAKPPGVEIAEFVELARQVFAVAEPVDSTNSLNSTAVGEQLAIYPPNSILSDWMDYARDQEESADAFLIGAIVPFVAACLARRVWFAWGEKRVFPNLFTILVGKPGDRKSSVILSAKSVASAVLPTNAFLPDTFSPETLFDEYAEEEGGRPDKFWVVDDANTVLTDWEKSANGQRVAARFLKLYDCAGFSESFRRNKKDEADSPRRSISESSTSVLFGATFNIAAFEGQAVRAGMARRFLYYVGEVPGRVIVRPTVAAARRRGLGDQFRRLLTLQGEMDFTSAASTMWKEYQLENRREALSIDSRQEDVLSRLSSAPMQVLHMAMIFEAASWAKHGGEWTGLIQDSTLMMAIQHVAECLAASKRLDGIAHKSFIAAESSVLLDHVRKDFPLTQGGFHFVTRSELTKRYCPNSGRPGSWKPDDLYLRFIPWLTRRREAALIRERTKGYSEVFAFVAEK